MTYKNLLVHLDNTQACKKRMETAIAIASAHNAHLAVLFCVGAFELPTWAEVPRDMVEEQRKLDEKRAAEVTSDFEGAAKRAGINYETRHANVADYAVPDTVALHARYSDLVILGQTDPDEVREGTRLLVEHVVMAAGRDCIPTTLLPSGIATVPSFHWPKPIPASPTRKYGKSINLFGAIPSKNLDRFEPLNQNWYSNFILKTFKNPVATNQVWRCVFHVWPNGAMINPQKKPILWKPYDH